jgi:hypothetical protein
VKHWNKRAVRGTSNGSSWLRSTRAVTVVVWTLASLALTGVAGATADGGVGEPGAPSDFAFPLAPAQQKGNEAESLAETNPSAASGLQLDGIGREEATDLFAAVFPQALELPAGVFGDLEVVKYNSDYAAVVAPSASPAGGDHRGLLVSALPLRTEDDSGSKTPVDLELESSSGTLQSSNPLTDVEIPSHLEEGIELPESGVNVALAGAVLNRSPSSIEDSAAFYPNVAVDSDFVVSPTPTGFETFTQLRSADAPTSQRFDLTVPAGANVEATVYGGARVTKGEEVLVAVQPPAAYDANGDPVPVSLSVSEGSIEVHSSPGADVAYPIIVDPVFESWNWYGGVTASGLEPPSWYPAVTGPAFKSIWMGAWGQFGLNMYTYAGATPAGGQANWNYYVPRYFADVNDPAINIAPTSYVKNMMLSQVYFWIEEAPTAHANPTIVAGLWDGGFGWISFGAHNSLEGQYANVSLGPYTNPNENENVKNAGIGLLTGETQSYPRHLLVGAASVEVSDKEKPAIATLVASSGWFNNQASTPITYSVMDIGLGVYELQLKQPLAAGGTKELKTPVGCVGTSANACPRTVTSATKALVAEPSTMPTGENMAVVTATDPLGQKSVSQEVRIKVDHVAPSITLSGTATEQSTLGPKRPTYTIKAKVTDGTEAAPQSGVAKAELFIDGTKVPSATKEPKCATKNCSAEVEFTIEASKYSAGTHTVKVTAEDAVGIPATKEWPVTLTPSTPTLGLAGTATEQGTLGLTRPRYKLRYTASDGTGPAAPPKPGLVASYSFDEGTGTVAHDSTGNHNLSIKGAKWVLGKYGTGLEFNAANKDILTVPGTEDLRLKEFTLEAWINPDESRKFAPVISKTEAGDYGYALYAGGETPGYPEGYVTNHSWVDAFVYAEEPLENKHWTHVVLTNDGKDLSLIVNGALVAQEPSIGVQAGKGPLNIGGDEPFAAGGAFDGKLDELRVYERALSVTEARSDKNTAIQSPPTGGPVAAYPFDAASAGYTLDMSGKNHHAATKSVTAVAGKYGNALEFKAANKSGLTIPDSEDLRFEKFTLEAWVNPSETRAHAPIIAKGSPSGYGYALYAGGGSAGHPEGFVTYQKWADSYAYSPKTLTNNAWSWVTLTNDGEYLRLAINGEEVAKEPAKEVEAGTGNLTIGSTEAFGAAEYFSGKLDNLRLYNRVLSAAELITDKESVIGASPTETNMPAGVSKAEVTLDGNVIDSSVASCASANCFITREPIVSSSGLAAGKHTLLVKVTDNFGNVATKTQSIEIQKDVTKPTIQLSGELPTAPEGWVEQDNYGFKAEAADAGGYGVTALTLTVDGGTVASSTSTCPDGSCPMTLNKPVNTTAFSGGAHAASVVATDGAGNTATKNWTINVDPQGQITTEEAEDTLEAFDETSSINTVGEMEGEDELEGMSAGLEFEQSGDRLNAVGSEAPTSVATDPTEGMIVETVPEDALVPSCLGEDGGEDESEEWGSEAEKEEYESTSCEAGPGLANPEPLLTPVELEPVAVSESATDSTLTDSEESAVVANLRASTDLVTRPLFDGAMTFAAIRDAAGPDSFSWTVVMGADQELKAIDSQNVGVYYEDGPMAISIAAAPARDALGNSVPTSISVSSGNVLTLTVGHKAGAYTYPVVAGVGWQGGIQSIYIAMPPGQIPGNEPDDWEAALGSLLDKAYENAGLEPNSTSLSVSVFGPPETLSGSQAAADNAYAFSDPEAGASGGPLGVQCQEVVGQKCRRRPFAFNKCTFVTHAPGGGSNPGKDILPPSVKRIMVSREAQQCHGKYNQPQETYLTVRWAIAVHGKFGYRYGKAVWLGGKPGCKTWVGPDITEYEKPKNLRCHPSSTYSRNKISVNGRWRWHPGTYEPPRAPINPFCGILEGVLPKEPEMGSAKEGTGEWTYDATYHYYHHPVEPADAPCQWTSLDKQF